MNFLDRITGWLKLRWDKLRGRAIEDYIEHGIELQRFKTLMMKMHKGFPNSLYIEDEVHSIIKMEETRKQLENEGYFRREMTGDKTYYAMGPKGLELVNSWVAEGFTVMVFFIGLLALLLQVLQMGLDSMQSLVEQARVNSAPIEFWTRLSNLVAVAFVFGVFLAVMYVAIKAAGKYGWLIRELLN